MEITVKDVLLDLIQDKAHNYLQKMKELDHPGVMDDVTMRQMQGNMTAVYALKFCKEHVTSMPDFLFSTLDKEALNEKMLADITEIAASMKRDKAEANE